MALSSAQSKLVRESLAATLGIDPERVVPEANLFLDLGGTGEHLKPLRLGIEAALGVRLEPITEQINARTMIGPDGRVTASSLGQIRDYLGQESLVPREPVSFPELFRVAFVEATASRAVREQIERTAEQERSRAVPDLAPAHSRIVREQLSRMCEIPVERLTPDTRLVQDFEEDFISIGFAFVTIEQELGVTVSGAFKAMLTYLGDVAAGQATPFALEELLRFLPELDLERPDSISVEESITVGLLERVVAAAIAAREPMGTGGTGPAASAPRRSADSPVIASWTWAQQNWMWDLPARLGPRRLRLLLAGGCRLALQPDRKPEFDLVDVLETLEKYADTEKNKSALEKAFRSSGQWRTWRHPKLAAIHLSLSEADPEGALPRVVTAIAVAHKLEDEAAFTRLEQLVAELAGPQPAGPPVFDPRWRTPEAVELAWTMYEARDFRAMPQLADLLERAGCREAAVLDHCRGANAFHCRGCWVLDAVLDGRWAKPPRAKPPKTKTLLSTLSKRDRAAIQETMETPAWKMTIPELIRRGEAEPFEPHAAHWASLYPGLSPDQVRSAYGLSQAVDHGRGAAPLAEVRRIVDEEATGQVSAISVSARLNWIQSLTFRGDDPAAMLIRQALAVRDRSFAEHVAAMAPRRPAMQWDPAYWTYLATLAIALRDDPLLQEMAARLDGREPPPHEEALDQVLLGIARRDGPQVQRGIQHAIERERRVRDKIAYGLLCPEAHELYRLAEFASPDLVAGFDVAQPFPWDAEFHRCTEAVDNPLEGIDLGSLPPLVRDAIQNLRLPDWLGDPQHIQKMILVDVVLMAAGPNPKKVAAFLRRHAGFEKDQADRALQRLPLVIRSRTHEWFANQCRDELGPLGATIETF